MQTIYSCKCSNDTLNGKNVECIKISRSISTNPNNDVRLLEYTFLPNARLLRYQWHSTYLNQTMELRGQHEASIDSDLLNIIRPTNYFDDHPEIKLILKDLLLLLIQSKPEKVLDFIVQYFENFIR